jgi:hypothetical protein
VKKERWSRTFFAKGVSFEGDKGKEIPRKEDSEKAKWEEV